MSRLRTNPESLAMLGVQGSTPGVAGVRQPRQKTLGLSAEEQRLVDNAKRIRADAAAGTLEDLTGFRGKELMSRLLRK